VALKNKEKSYKKHHKKGCKLKSRIDFPALFLITSIKDLYESHLKDISNSTRPKGRGFLKWFCPYIPSFKKHGVLRALIKTRKLQNYFVEFPNSTTTISSAVLNKDCLF